MVMTQPLGDPPNPTISPSPSSIAPILNEAPRAEPADMEESTPQHEPRSSTARRRARLLRLTRRHEQFGPIGDRRHRYVSRHHGGEFLQPIVDSPPFYYLFTTYMTYFILMIYGQIRDFYGKRYREARHFHLKAKGGYGALNDDFENFYARRVKHRINDCFERPTTGVPGRFITLIDRQTTDDLTHYAFPGTTTRTLNLSSYNYLGFAQSEGPCADAVEQAIRAYGISSVGTRADAGCQDLHVEVEKLIAKFVGKDDAIVFSMGFATNATIFPNILNKGCLVLSDEFNHASIRFGVRASGADLRVFEHNDLQMLEYRLKEAIAWGQPRTRRPWKKILVVIEGIYSMEGSMPNLPKILELKQKYKFHLFMDEAHSIGAIGPHGKGVCDYFGIDPSNIDILMGTLTKSFGANGGYIAADQDMIKSLRASNSAVFRAEAPTPPILTQIFTALKIINGELFPGQGEERLQRLAFNSRYLRLGLKRLGFIIYGFEDSPVIPILMYNPAKIGAFSHQMLKRKISVVVVGHPATGLVTARSRICVSASHTKDDLDYFLRACDEVGDMLSLKLSSGIAGGLHEPPPQGLIGYFYQPITRRPRWTCNEVIDSGVRDVQGPLY